jgi:hypothetical protein
MVSGLNSLLHFRVSWIMAKLFSRFHPNLSTLALR